MKRLLVCLSLLLSIFVTGTLYSGQAETLIPADAKLLVMINSKDMVEKVISGIEDNDEDVQEMIDFLKVFDDKDPVYISMFGEFAGLKDFDEALESNLVIIASLKGSPDDLYKKVEEMTEEKRQNLKQGVVGIDDVFILPLTGKQVAISPMADTLYRYKKAKRLNAAKGEDGAALKQFVKEYTDKEMAAIVVPSVFSQLLESTPIPFPPSLSKYNPLDSIKDLILFSDKESFTVSLRMKQTTDALKNIFTAKNPGISVKEFSLADPTGYVELSFSPDFLKDIVLIISEQTGSAMPPEMLDSVFSALTGNFGVSVWPAKGKSVKEITEEIPRILAFVGTTSDSAAQQLLGVIGAMSPFTTITVAGKEVFEMAIKEESKLYLTVDKSHIIGSLDKDTLEAYIKNSGAGKEKFSSSLIKTVFARELQGISVFVKTKDIMDMLGDEIKMGGLTRQINFDHILLYIGPSGQHDALNIKGFYK